MTNSRLAFHLDSGGGGWTESTNEGPTPTRTVAGPYTLTFLAGWRLTVKNFRSSRRCCRLSYRRWLARGRWAPRSHRFLTHVGPKEALRDPPDPRAAESCSWVTDW